MCLQGTIISIFNEDSTLGKKYVFDIRRTCREVYDNARRALYCESANINLPVENNALEKHNCGDCENSQCKVKKKINITFENIDMLFYKWNYWSIQNVFNINSTFMIIQDTRECLARLLDAMLCRICMDRSLDTALFPCGHAVACLDCARRCERCPLCRADIDHCRTIYLPIELMHIDKQNPRISDESIDSVLDVKSSTRMLEQRIQNTISVNNNAIWESRVGLRFNYFRRVLKLFSCGFDRAYWSSNDWEPF